MSYPILEPRLLTNDTTRLITNICDDEEVVKFNKVHFGFNGSSAEWGGYRVMLPPNKQTNDQNVKVEMKDFANGHKTSKLWTIVLKYSIDHWDNLMSWAKTKAVTFDAMLYSSRGGNFIHRPFFHCFMTRDRTCEYKLTRDNFVGIAKIQFKNGGIKVVKKEDKVVVVVKLLEAGFYQRYNYIVVDHKNPQTGYK